MHSKITTTIFTILLLTINFTTAWTLRVYPSTQDCIGDTFIKYDSSNTSPQCFVAGRPGAGVDCQMITDCGKTWRKCKNSASAADPDKLSFTISQGNRCAWVVAGDACAGNSLASDGQYLKGKDYGSGNDMRIQCANN